MSGKPKDVTEAGGLKGGFTEPMEAPPDPNAPKPAADPFAISWKWLGELGADWLDTAPAARRWLLERDETDAERLERSDRSDVRDRVGVLPLGKVGMLVAAGGVGKTMALVQLALAVATGRRWLGTFHVPEDARGAVLLALAEEDAEEVRRRVYNAAASMGLEEHDRRAALACIVALPLAGTPVALVRGDGKGNVSETDTLAALRSRLSSAKDANGAPVVWRLIVLDPLSRWAGADTEKDNAAATRFVEAVETLALASPGTPAVLLAHHTPKVTRAEGERNDATAARGASGLADGARWVANPDNAEAGATLSIPTKSNYSRAIPRFVLELARDHHHGGALRPLTTAERAAREKSEKTKRDAEKGNEKGRRHGRESADEDRELK